MTPMKVIGTDNFSRDSVSDFLVCTNVCEFYGEMIVNMLNKNNGDNGPTFYRLVPDDHVLYEWEP
jgi:hypothetical protein